MSSLKMKLIEAGAITVTAIDEKKIEKVFMEIKDNGLKSKDGLKTLLKHFNVTDTTFIQYLIKNPDVDVLDWLDTNPEQYDGIGLFDKKWIRRNIDKNKIAPKFHKRLGLAKLLVKAGLDVKTAKFVDNTRGGVPVGNYTFVFKPEDKNLGYIVRSAEARKMKTKIVKDTVEVSGHGPELTDMVESFKKLNWDGEVTQK